MNTTAFKFIINLRYVFLCAVARPIKHRAVSIDRTCAFLSLLIMSVASRPKGSHLFQTMIAVYDV